jgi:hypothetical protein
MPFYSITGAYLNPGEGSGSVDAYGWSGEAQDRADAENKMQDQAREDNEERIEDDSNLIEVIDVWEIHPDDYREGPADRKLWVRMRPA